MLSRLTLIVLGAFALTFNAYANEYFVTELGDSGAGTLRAEIANAISNPGPDSVIVDVKGKIVLNSPITITDAAGLTIIGATAKHTHIAPSGTFSGFQLINIAGSANVTIQAMRFEPDVSTGMYRQFILFSEYTGPIRVERCVFEGNLLPGPGGALGILNPAAGAGASVEIVSCSFINNRAQAGGAIHVENGNAILTNNTFYLNQALGGTGTAFGGAIYVESTDAPGVFLNHNTFKNNNYSGPGNGEVIHAASGSVMLRNNAGAGNGLFDQFTGAILYGTNGGNKILQNYSGEPAPWAIPMVTDDMSLGVYPGLRDTLKTDGYGLKYYPIQDSLSTYCDAGTWISPVQFDCRRSPRVIDWDGDGTVLPDAGAAEYTRLRVINAIGGPSTNGTLEWCIAQPKNNPVEYIEFDLPVPLPDVPSSVDMIVSDPLIIDGFSQEGCSVPGPALPGSPTELTPGMDLVVIDGGGTSTDGFSLTSTADGTIISGLRIHSFTEHGIASNADNVIIFGNAIGILASNFPAGNGFAGILINRDFSTIGGRFHHQRNVVSGNGGGGDNTNIEIASTADNTGVFGNIIGIGDNGILPMSGAATNQGIGIKGTQTRIGDSGWRLKNVIGGHDLGIAIVGGSTTRIFNNFIGVANDGSTLRANDVGIDIMPMGVTGSDLDIGKEGKDGGNIISGNTTAGIRFQYYDGVYIVNNLIGPSIGGNAAAGPQEFGILVEGAVNNLTIGDVSSFGGPIRNIISGNEHGLQFSSIGPNCKIQNNHIGTNTVGTGALANSQNGIHIIGTANNITIGDAAPSLRNVISGNTNGSSNACGIKIDGTGSHTISGNFIGIGRDNSPLGNDRGIESIGGTAVQIGNSGTPGSGNIISANNEYGVYVHSGGNDIDLHNNFIGTDSTGMLSGFGNVLSGVRISDTDGCLIGSDLNNGNVICGSIGFPEGFGIFLDGTGMFTVIRGNHIGLNSVGIGALANQNGIKIADSHQAAIGGDFGFNEENLISGNTQSGVWNSSMSGSVLDGNIIGLNAFSAPLPNVQHGVRTDADGFTIGSTFGNVIAANGIHGIYVDGDAADNTLINNNMIGTNLAGAFLLGNGSNGIRIIAGDDNQIGTGGKNVIVANGLSGIHITSGANDNIVRNNEIGVNGLVANGNGQNGVEIDLSSMGNEIGGIWATERNIISGNGANGVRINLDAVGNLIIGNTIGDDGTLGFGNQGDGIHLQGGANATQIGKQTAAGSGTYNVISGNMDDGIYIDDVSGTLVRGNLIGLDFTGSVAIPNDNGIYLSADATINYIGISADPFTRNTISANTLYGIQCHGDNNEIVQNYIGTDSSGTLELGVQDIGVLFGNTSSGNVLGGNRTNDFNQISGNTTYGVQMQGMADTVMGNYFGIGAGGVSLATEQENAIRVHSDASDNVIGDAPKETFGNVMVNQNLGGILIEDATTTKVGGNYIGISDADATIGYMEYGVLITSIAGPDNQIGIPDISGQNIISNNEVGVIIQGAVNQKVYNNYVGTNSFGNVAFPNEVGILLESGTSNDTIGGPGDLGNLIAGNSEYGMIVTDDGTNNNVIIGNTIGLDAGDLGLGNPFGIAVGNGPSGTQIGSSTAGHSNNIAASDTCGVLIDGSNTTSTRVYANSIGNAFYPNAFGVVIQNGSELNEIGGVLPGEGNVISGNDSTAVSIFSSNSNSINQNIIGLSAAGDVEVANNLGVHIVGSSFNYIGESSAVTGNTITGNIVGGVLLDGAANNFVQHNIIGLDPTGMLIPDGYGNPYGVRVSNGSLANQIGGTETNEGNQISNNEDEGIVIDNSAANKILGNNIGFNADFSAPISNQYVGIRIENNSAANFIGDAAGTQPENTISGHPVNIQISNSDSNKVVNNFIGTDENGDAVVSGTEVQSVGVFIEQASSFNEVDANIISGHEAGFAIRIHDIGSDFNVVKRNHIGLDYSGMDALPNLYGIIVSAGPENTYIGIPGEGNVISANDSAAVAVQGPNTDSTFIQANYIGTASDGTGVFNSIFGIGVFDAASNTFIGGSAPAESNFIVGTDSVSIYLFNDATLSFVQGNYIGVAPTSADVPSGEIAVLLDQSSQNVIGGPTPLGNIIGNVNTGIALRNGSLINPILGNTIFNIPNQAIDLDDDDLPLPIDGTVDLAQNNIHLDQVQPLNAFACVPGGNTRLSLISTLPVGNTYRLEFFENSTASGDSELFLEAASVDYTPLTNPDTIEISTLPADMVDSEITVTATEFFGGTGYGNTTELSAGIIVVEPPLVTITPTDVSCGTNSDGEILVEAPGFSFYSELAPNGEFFVTDDTTYIVPVGDYDISVRFDNGCIHGPETITVDTADMSGLYAGPDIEVCEGSQVQLEAYGGITYLWDDDTDISELNISDPTARPSSEKYYFVTITAANGCDVRDSVYISYLALSECDVNVYNVITPNGDGDNDFFYIEGVEGYPSNTVIIYNRWGDVIRTIPDYDNVTNIWDGTKRNGVDLVPTGTYYYVLDINNRDKNEAGWIQVLH